MKAIKDFFDFEIRNNLFDIKDQKGFTIWESIRYSVCNQVVMKWETHIINPTNNVSRFFLTLKQIVSFFVYLFLHRRADILFFLCSRDKRDGVYYDKILDDVYDLSDKARCFVIESHNINVKEQYKYKGESCTTIIVSLIKKMLKRKTFNAEINGILATSFPGFSFDFNELQNDYQNFYAQYYFYRFVFKICKIKKLFLVQNGIQKGMFAAAKEYGVKVIELQHGQVSENHLSYSYPTEMANIPNKVYTPDYFLTFGNFWMKNNVFPGVKIEALGNNFYSQESNMDSKEDVRKKILVISSFVHGDVLSHSVKEILTKDDSFYFYFKLHPNEFVDVEKYETFFNCNKNVKIIRNEATVSDLLSQTEFVFLVQSTAELEALKNGKKVIVLKRIDYEVMDFVFSEKGIYLIDEPEEFIDCYNAHKNDKIETRNDIFQKFDKEKALQMLNFFLNSK